MALFWQKYFDTFASIFSRDLSKEAPDPTFLSGAGIGRADGIGTSEYLEGGSTFTHSVEIRPLNDFLEVGEHTDRRARYLEYDRLENIGEISSAMNIYSDETTTPDIEGRVFTIICHKQEIKDELEWLFFDLLDLETEALWSWCRNLCKNDDLFLELIIDPDHPEYGVQRVTELPPETMYRIETVRGRLLEFQQSYLGPDYQVILNDLNNAAQAQNSAVGWMPGLSPVTTTGTPLASPTYMQGRCIRFKPEQILHIRIGTNRRGFYPYGVSVLYAARRIAHILQLMEDAALVYRLCLTGDSRVRTINGYKRIKDIIPGDMTYSFTKDGLLEETQITHHINNGIQKILKVRSKHIEIRGTYTHPVLVKDNETGNIEYVDLQDLKIRRHQLINVSNDIELDIPIPKWEYKYNENKTKAQNDQNKNLIKTDGINLPEFVDEDFARLFGFLLGDGSIRDGEINFSSGVDEKLNKKYSDLLFKFFGKVVFCQDKRHKIGLGKYVVYSKVASDIFDTLGLKSGHDKKRIPDWAFSSSKKIRKSLIEGLADADGSVRFTKTGLWTAIIATSNEQLIEDTKELWSSMGLSSGHIICRDRRDEFHQIEEGRTISGGLSWWIYISKLPLPKYENVLTIEEDGEEEVFDITVENEEHNFVVNSTISHNTRAPERRIFYIDVGSLPPNKGDLVVERIKDKIKKKKVFNRHGGNIDERYSPMSADEDFFIATRPEANTRIETLPGAANLDQILDIKYFREKLMIALNLPKNFLLQEDAAITRTSYATQDMRFARTIYRIQKFVANGLKQVAIRHLLLKGYPEEETRKIQIKFTQPSDWLELSRSEILNNRYNLASSIKGGQIYDDYTILTKILKHTHEESLEIISRKEKELLRQQEIQAQAQVFAQLATPVEEPMGGSGGGIEGAPEMSQEVPGDELEGIPQTTEPTLPTVPSEVPKVEAPKSKKPERFKDWESMEADHEEEDLSY